MLTNSVFDLDVAMSPSFVEALGRATQDLSPKLVLSYTTTPDFKNFALKQFIRGLAPGVHAAGRTVVLLEHTTTAVDLDTLLAKDLMGWLVLMGELVPSERLEQSLVVAAQMVAKGATVLASIHAYGESAARQRLEFLWFACPNPYQALDFSALPVEYLSYDVKVTTRAAG